METIFQSKQIKKITLEFVGTVSELLSQWKFQHFFDIDFVAQNRKILKTTVSPQTISVQVIIKILQIFVAHIEQDVLFQEIDSFP